MAWQGQASERHSKCMSTRCVLLGPGPGPSADRQSGPLVWDAGWTIPGPSTAVIFFHLDFLSSKGTHSSIKINYGRNRIYVGLFVFKAMSG